MSISRKFRYRSAIGIVLCFCTFSSSNADQWGHWRGPLGNGVATSANPPVEFGPNKNTKWKSPIEGRGSSSPVVWNDAVFVTSAVGSQNGRGLQFQVFCLDRKDGSLRWKQTAVEEQPHEGTHETNGYASASPCTDGSHVYAFFGSRGLYCYTMDGKLEWKRDFGDMRIRNAFGEGASPTIAGDLLIVPWDQEANSMLFALNKKTGDIQWKTAREEPTCWATPLIAKDSNGKEQVVMNGQRAARGYDLTTGKELWYCGGQTERPCASAVAENGIAYVGSGHRGSFLGAFDLTGTGNLAGTKSVLWSLKQDTPDVPSPLLTNGKLYFYKGRTGQLSCVDAKSGKIYFGAMRVPGIDNTYASPIAAGGHLYLTDRRGTIVVIDESDKLNVVATNKMEEDVDATPAVSDNEIFIRTEKHLYCFSNSQK